MLLAVALITPPYKALLSIRFFNWKNEVTIKFGRVVGHVGIIYSNHAALVRGKAVAEYVFLQVKLLCILHVHRSALRLLRCLRYACLNLTESWCSFITHKLRFVHNDLHLDSRIWACDLHYFRWLRLRLEHLRWIYVHDDAFIDLQEASWALQSRCVLNWARD